MKLLADTHIMLWAALVPEKLSRIARELLNDQANVIVFSVVSLWEVSIKRSLGHTDFQYDPRVIRRGLLDNGYEELTITSEHAVLVDRLPLLHKDPFHRLLVAQANFEGLVLLTADKRVAEYPGAIRLV